MFRKLLIRSIPILSIFSLFLTASGQQLVTGEIQVRDYHFDLTRPGIGLYVWVVVIARLQAARWLVCPDTDPGCPATE